MLITGNMASAVIIKMFRKKYRVFTALSSQSLRLGGRRRTFLEYRRRMEMGHCSVPYGKKEPDDVGGEFIKRFIAGTGRCDHIAEIVIIELNVVVIEVQAPLVDVLPFLLGEFITDAGAGGLIGEGAQLLVPGKEILRIDAWKKITIKISSGLVVEAILELEYPVLPKRVSIVELCIVGRHAP